MRKPISAAYLSVGVALGGIALLGSRPQPRLGTVNLFLSTDCPVAKTYTPRIQALAKEYTGKGFEFQAYFPNALETQAGAKEYMQERGYDFGMTMDPGGQVAKTMGVTHVPYVVVVGVGGKVAYRGAIDDHKDPTLVKKRYLRDALDAMAANKPVKINKTELFGCLLMPGEAPPTAKSVNYAEHIAPILNRACVECHRPGEVAPFSLIGYDNAKKWAPMIAQVTQRGVMPPWKAKHGYGEFLDENRVDETELKTLQLWNEAGAPSGDLAKAPKTPQFADEWSLGTPDLIIQSNQDFTLDADGRDEYRHFVIDPGNKETIWVRGMDVKPGNREVVHHVIAFIDTSGKAERKAAETKDGKEGYDTFGGPGFVPFGALGGWAPGLRVRLSDPDEAFEIPAGAKIVMQVHYHRNGKVAKDRTRLGLYLAKKPPVRPMRLAWLANPLFRIPPGAESHKVVMDYRVPMDVTIFGSMPHMHLLGKSMRAEVRMPDGTVRPLIWVEKWDFNWQLQYTLKQPMKVPAGSRIYVESYFDNSANNPNNPNDPPKAVTWGEETTDEMFLLIVPYSIDAETMTNRFKRGFGPIG